MKVEELTSFLLSFYIKQRKIKFENKFSNMIKDIDFNKLNTGTGVPSMTSSILYDLNIVVPEENILEKFNTVVKRNYETIKLNNIQNQELTQLRDWLLPMLMNGQVKVE